MKNLEANQISQSSILVSEFELMHTDAVIKLITGIQSEEFGIPITIDQQPDLLDIPNFYQRGKGNFWVARIDSEVIGTISLLDLGQKKVALRKMFVDSQYRGPKYGVAARLIQSVFKWCALNAVEEIFLGTTTKFLAAHRFYEKNGFSEISKEDLPDSFPVLTVDSKFYSIKI